MLKITPYLSIVPRWIGYQGRLFLLRVFRAWNFPTRTIIVGIRIFQTVFSTMIPYPLNLEALETPLTTAMF